MWICRVARALHDCKRFLFDPYPYHKYTTHPRKMQAQNQREFAENKRRPRQAAANGRSGWQ